MSDNNTDTGDTQIHNSMDTAAFITPRESLITTAINFLQNPNVSRSPLSQKQNFLRSKGLTENEIQIACERAGVFTRDPNSTVINMGITTGTPSTNTNQYLVQPKLSTFSKIREVLNSMALLSGIAYAIYLFYKKFIEPFLFGRKKKKTVEETLEEIDQKVENQIKDLSRELIQIKEKVSNNQNDTLSREFSSFKSDLEAIKGLLLNRKQFANPLPTVPPSIPAWQLSSHHSHSETDKNDDAGSGSGSSETEVVTKNSDSSLEIM